jgi:hypothetical protein
MERQIQRGAVESQPPLVEEIGGRKKERRRECIMKRIELWRGCWLLHYQEEEEERNDIAAGRRGQGERGRLIFDVCVPWCEMNLRQRVELWC